MSASESEIDNDETSGIEVSRSPTLWAATVLRGFAAGLGVYLVLSSLNLAAALPMAVGTAIIAAALPMLFAVARSSGETAGDGESA